MCQSLQIGSAMSHFGRRFSVFSNKFFSVNWASDHFIWSTDTKKAEFRCTPDGSFADARFVACLFDKYWNDGRITDAEYRGLSSFREDVKHGKFDRPVRRGPVFTWNPPASGHAFDTVVHDELFSEATLERARAALQGATWRSPADRARNP